MAGLNSFDAESLRRLKIKIDAVIKANSIDLAGGNSIIIGDIAATAQHYGSAVNYIRALHDVLAMCQDVEDDLLGRNEKKEASK